MYSKKKNSKFYVVKNLKKTGKDLKLTSDFVFVLISMYTHK